MKLQEFLLLLFYPYKKISYFEKYFSAVNANASFNGKNHSLFRYQIKSLNIILYLKCFHFIYLGLVRGYSPLDRALQFDGLYLLIQKPRINLFAALITPMLIYLNNCMFFNCNTKLNDHLYAVIVQNDVSNFKSETFGDKYIGVLAKKFYTITLNLFISLHYTLRKF